LDSASILCLLFAYSEAQNLGAKWAQNPAFLSTNRGMAGE
jgi:hypothetical protein